MRAAHESAAQLDGGRSTARPYRRPSFSLAQRAKFDDRFEARGPAARFILFNHHNWDRQRFRVDGPLGLAVRQALASAASRRTRDVLDNGIFYDAVIDHRSAVVAGAGRLIGGAGVASVSAIPAAPGTRSAAAAKAAGSENGHGGNDKKPLHGSYSDCGDTSDLERLWAKQPYITANGVQVGRLHFFTNRYLFSARCNFPTAPR